VRALELSGSDRTTAEDLAQEAFARALVHWPRVSGGSNPAGYVYKTAFRLARRSWWRPRPEALPDRLEEAGEMAGEAVTSVAIEAALAGMPPRRRACAVLCFVVGCTPKEAGAALGVAEGTVRKQLALAREALADALRDDA
jgi:RNA polymerase sigma factor (sigma-70 family)